MEPMVKFLVTPHFSISLLSLHHVIIYISTKKASFSRRMPTGKEIPISSDDIIQDPSVQFTLFGAGVICNSAEPDVQSPFPKMECKMCPLGTVVGYPNCSPCSPG